VIVFRDISVQQKLQRERSIQNYLQVMFASVNHELRTPINVVLNCIRCLEPSATPGQMRWLKIACTSSEFLLSLVNDTLDFT